MWYSVVLCVNNDECVPSSLLGFFYVQFHSGRPDPQGWHVLQSGRIICDTSMYFLWNFSSCQEKNLPLNNENYVLPGKCLSNSQLSMFEFWGKISVEKLVKKKYDSFLTNSNLKFLDPGDVFFFSSWGLESSPASEATERYLAWTCKASCHNLAGQTGLDLKRSWCASLLSCRHPVHGHLLV